jgi:cystathionine gamma-synthase
MAEDSSVPPVSPMTLAAHAGFAETGVSGDVVPPIRPASTFARDPAYALESAFEYQRDDTPTALPAETLLTRLEGGRESLLFASGMAAAAALVQALRPGDHIVAQRAMYWGLRIWLEDFCARWGVGLDLVAPDAAALRDAIRPGTTRLVWVETPSNPTWDVVDIAAAAEAAHAAGAHVVVDSTVATPVHTRPIALGADVVLHSASKALNGHSDVVAGALVTADPDAALWARVRDNRKHHGAIPGPFEAWLLQRGMRTLFPRMRQMSASAARIAEHCAGHPAVAAVLYPGRRDHPGHDVATRQMADGFGAMLSLRVAGGRDAALRVVRACRLFRRATSLGGVESLVEHRATIEGEGTPVPDDLLRLSIGIEDAADLIADLDRALGQA